MHLNHRFLKGVGIALLVPIILVLLLVVAVYLPPIQRWAVDKAADTMGQKMGLTVSVGSVRLTPFLDLRLQNVTALDEGQDTVLHTTDLLLDVAFAPLFEGRADIEGFQLRGARIDTKSFVPMRASADVWANSQPWRTVWRGNKNWYISTVLCWPMPTYR